MHITSWLTAFQSFALRSRARREYERRSFQGNIGRPEQLEDRTLLSYTNAGTTLVGTDVTFVGDGSADTLTFTTDGGGFLQHNRFGLDVGFNSAIDLDPNVAGDQPVLVANITTLSALAGGNDDVVQLNGLGLAAATSVILDGQSGNDTIETITAAVSVGAGSATFTAETININSALSVSTTLTLDSAGGNVTQTAAISSTTLILQGAAATFTLNTQNNNVTTLDANNNTLTALSFRDDNGYDVAGATASGAVTLSSTSTVTQSAVISGTTLTLEGAAATFTLNTQNNNVTTLDANNNTLTALSFRDDNGYDVAGATASGAVTLSSTSTVTQSALISGTTLTLEGAAATFTLNTQNNNVTTLDANNNTLTALSFRDDNGYDVAGATASGAVTLSSTSTVTQSAVISGTTLTLLGTGGAFNLGTQNNNFATLDADTNTLASLSYRDDNGFDVAGAHTSGNTTLSSTSPVTQSAAITAAGLELLGAGGTFTLNTQNNPITTLAGNTGTVLFQDNSGFSIGTVNTVGLTASTSVRLSSTGTVSQTQAIVSPTLILEGAAGIYNLGSNNNDVDFLDANNSVLTSLSFRDDDGFQVDGATMTGGLTLNASTVGSITQSVLISAGTTNLTGGVITLTLANVLGALTVQSGTGAVSITENDVIDVSAITHNTGNLILQAGANIINVNGPIAITTGDAQFLTTTTLNVFDNITATVISGTAVTVNVQNNTAQIQDGVDAALPAGATVNVNANATFSEHVSVSTNIALVATVNTVTINSPTAAAALTVTAGTVSATGFNLTSTGPAGDTVLVSGGSLKLRNNFITESTTGAQTAITVTGGALDLGATDDPGNNSITSAASHALLNTAVAVNASGNYWGTSVQATIAADLTGAIDYTPYINIAGDTSAAVGYQGNFTDLTVHAQGTQTGAIGRITEGYNLLNATAVVSGTIHVLTGIYTENVDLGAAVATGPFPVVTNKAVIFHAGASPGQVQINGSLTLTSNDTLPIELTGFTAPGPTGPLVDPTPTNFDNFVVTGTVTLGNATLSPTVTYAAQPYERFTIINNLSAGAVVGTFGGLPEGSVINVAGVRLRVSYIEFHNPSSVPPTPGSFYGNGNDVSLTVMTPPILVTQGVNGDLTLDGTGWNDDITLSFTGTNQLTLIGNDVSNFSGPLTTNVQLAGPYTVTGNIIIKLGNGKDKVLIRGVGPNATYDSGNLSIDLGSDDDAVTTIDDALVPIITSGLRMTGNLSIVGGAGVDNVTLGSNTATDTLTALNVSIDTGAGAGAQTISLDRLTANGNVTLANGGLGAQTVALGANISNAPNSIQGNLIINQLAAATSFTVGVHNTSVGGFAAITNGSGAGAAAVTIDTTAAPAQTIFGSTTITNGNNLTNAVSLVGTTGGLQLRGNVTVKNGSATTSNGITVTDLTDSGTTSSSFTNGSSPANTIAFTGALRNTFLGVVSATNGASTGANVINATRLSSTKGLNLTNGSATTSNDVAVGGAGVTDLVSVTGNLVIANGASADTDVDINNLTTLGANAVGNVTMTNAATGVGGTTVTLGATAANSISGNLQITNQTSTGTRSVVMNQTTVSGRTGVNIYEIGAGDTSLTVGNVSLVTITNGLVIQDGTGSAAVNLLNLTAGNLNYSDLGGGTDTLNLADTAGVLRINGVTRIDTGAGSDTVRIATTGTAIFNDSVFVALGAGNDLLFIGANAASPALSAAGKFLFDGGLGTDTFNASPLSVADYTGSPLAKKVKSKILNFEDVSDRSLIG